MPSSFDKSVITAIIDNTSVSYTTFDIDNLLPAFIEVKTETADMETQKNNEFSLQFLSTLFYDEQFLQKSSALKEHITWWTKKKEN